MANSRVRFMIVIVLLYALFTRAFCHAGFRLMKAMAPRIMEMQITDIISIMLKPFGLRERVETSRNNAPGTG